MSKKRVNITVDPEVYRRAKEIGLNVSKVAENALQVAVHNLADEGAEESPFSSPGTPGDTSGRTKGKSNEEIIEDYREFARTALDRSEETVIQHLRYVERLLKSSGKSPGEISEEDIISYLGSEKPMSQSKHKNIVSALRVFFREYVERDVAEAFKVPHVGARPTTVPSKEKLQKFYEHLINPKYRAMFLTYATSGLRSGELRELEMEEIDLERRMLTPDKRSRTKQTWVSFYNEEAEEALGEFLPERKDGDPKLFQVGKVALNEAFNRASEESGIKITAPKLRKWFASEMATLGVGSSYIDAFCGRTPQSTLEKHYLDYSPRKLEEIYREAGIRVLK